MQYTYYFSDGNIVFSPRGLSTDLPDEISQLRLGELAIIATLGVGGFGRVELVSSFSTLRFRLSIQKNVRSISLKGILIRNTIRNTEHIVL